MKNLLFFLYVILSLEIYAQEAIVPVDEQAADSTFKNPSLGNQLNSNTVVIDRLPHSFLDEWKFINADSDSFASADWDDSKWQLIKSSMRTDSSLIDFNGIGWFRTKFIIDTTHVGKAFTMAVEHLGASETYLDGDLLIEYGEINGADCTEYYNPIDVPIMFTFQRAGEHVIAIRYANFNAQRNRSIFYTNFAGFYLTIDNTNLEDGFLWQMRLALFLLISGGIGIGLFVIHLFLYLFYRRNISNLYFGIFMMCFGSLLSGVFITEYVTHNSTFHLLFGYLIFPASCIACLSLSAFLNELFTKKKHLRFWLFCIFIAFILASYFSTIHYFVDILLPVLVYVCLEALFLIVRAIILKIQGAWIIGTGIVVSMSICSIVLIMTSSDAHYQLSSLFWGIFIFLVGTNSIPMSMSIHQAWTYSSLNKSLQRQLIQVKELSDKTLAQEIEQKKLLENRKEVLEKEVEVRTHKILAQKNELEKEKKKSDELLLNILPSEVAEELMSKGTADAKQFNDVTVMFTDFKNFTQVSEKLSPEELVAEIHYCFKEFDNIISRHNIEKIKTIGDSYMCAGGLPVVNETNAIDILSAALEIQNFIRLHVEERKKAQKEPFEIRIGIHTGPVVAGIVGVKKFAYDIWGDTVNIASRMESSGEAGKINISGSTYELVKNRFFCTHRGKIKAKNKGEIDMYFVEGVAKDELKI